jgi:hypothetical protein
MRRQERRQEGGKWGLDEKNTSLNNDYFSPVIHFGRKRFTLKEVCNEKEGGPEIWQMFAIGLGPWRSRIVFLLIFLSSLISMYFRFRQVKQN